jgi:hypothetical protein
MADVRDKLIKAIEVLAGKITGDIKSDDALKFAQAADITANTLRVLTDLSALTDLKISGYHIFFHP